MSRNNKKKNSDLWFQSKAAYVLVYQKQTQFQPNAHSKSSTTNGTMNGECDVAMETWCFLSIRCSETTVHSLWIYVKSVFLPEKRTDLMMNLHSSRCDKDVLSVLIFLIILEYKLYTVLPSKIHTSLIVYIFCWIWLHNLFYWSVVGFDCFQLKLTPGYNSLCTSTLTQNKQSNLLANRSNKYTSNNFLWRFHFELLYSSVCNAHIFCWVNYLTSLGEYNTHDVMKVQCF